MILIHVQFHLCFFLRNKIKKEPKCDIMQNLTTREYNFPEM